MTAFKTLTDLDFTTLSGNFLHFWTKGKRAVIYTLTGVACIRRRDINLIRIEWKGIIRDVLSCVANYAKPYQSVVHNSGCRNFLQNVADDHFNLIINFNLPKICLIAEKLSNDLIF
ncbi:hypothetical protein BpHYR1_034558 [Brachionus plicatilis]|uniref:Uncharacterized protein n=1 Tax=Brachionus plicatilis TaxID=10195 RepID=A0A3M7R0L2_BRAPC|nr:hypothetical protein BpHYR1_034558 [Brachionus plicatilis]